MGNVGSLVKRTAPIYGRARRIVRVSPEALEKAGKIAIIEARLPGEEIIAGDFDIQGLLAMDRWLAAVEPDTLYSRSPSSMSVNSRRSQS